MSASQEKTVVFTSDGHRLSGVLGRPGASVPLNRGVVLIHGWGGYRIGPHRILVQTARRLNQEGFTTLRFDLRGRGDSDGDAEKTCLDDMIRDTLAAVDCLAAESGVRNVTLLGLCSGANVAIGAATLRTETLKELVLWSALPFQPEQTERIRRQRMRHFIGRYIRKALRPETWKRLVRGDVNVRMVGRAIVGDRPPSTGEHNLKDSERDIMAAFESFSGHAILITGTKDPEGMVGHELFEKALRSQAATMEFHLIPGATHSFYAQAHKQAAIETTVSWLRKRALHDRPDRPR